ncbi:leucine--tRNA ligase [Patescibacteria group bacterium]|nr:leucine--tRNA ligase [Patescibacteria group bacterium]
MKRQGARYDHTAIERAWRAVWEKERLDVAAISGVKSAKRSRRKGPFYNLMMFPYPSAEGLHVGNMYAFTGSDIYGRFKRLQGYEVFEPIGLDGFGIHSENYALKIGRHPMDHAEVTEKRFYEQLHTIGAMYDWTRTVETYDPGYYRWTQWLFVQMFKHGLAYRGKAEVNWCPSCKTVLADEQVIDGCCERCGNIVEKRLLDQWFFRITAYAGKLLDNLKKLDWTEKVKVAQQNWIGQKQGIEITYDILTNDGSSAGEVVCFTTTPVNFAATFLVLSPEHPFVSRILQVTDAQRAADIRRYVTKTQQVSREERERQGKKKTGVFSGLYAVNHVTRERLPVWISDFVLTGVGTGAIQACPAHDARDYDFARTFGLPIRSVISFDTEVHIVVLKKFVSSDFSARLQKIAVYGEDRGEEYAVVAPRQMSEKVVRMVRNELTGPHAFAQADGTVAGVITKDGVLSNPDLCAEFFRSHGYGTDLWPVLADRYPFCYIGDGLMRQSGFLNGMPFARAMQKTMDYFEEKGWGKRVTAYHLRDWLISRQRYWGPPIPMIFCKECAAVGRSWFSTHEAKVMNIVSNNDMSGWPASKRLSAAMAGWYPVPERDLPVILPRIGDYRPGDDGVSPLAKHREFYETACPACGAKAVRETDVSDTFLDSSWYFLRYPSVHSGSNVAEVDRKKGVSDAMRGSLVAVHPSNGPAWAGDAGRGTPKKGSPLVGILGGTPVAGPAGTDRRMTVLEQTRRAASLELPWDPAITKTWLPVSLYTGGAEHSVLHLMYSRFVTMALHDWGLLPFDEPFPVFYAHGLIIKDGAKMSKSKGNVVNPDDYIGRYGADALRLYLMFTGPFDQGGDFRDSAMEGMSRWVGRVWRMALSAIEKHSKESGAKVETALQRTIQKVTADIEHRRYNTAIAALMTWTNLVADENGALGLADLSIFLRLLAPFAPFLTEELWHRAGETGPGIVPSASVHRAPWPDYDAAKVVDTSVTVVVQVDGKLRETFSLPSAGAVDRETVLARARKSDRIAHALGEAKEQKIIFIPGKLLNFVTR